LFCVDLDRFKIVNDSLGHVIGDLVIKAAAERIVAVLGSDDLVARFGGDEFIICCREVRGRKEAEVLATGLASAFAEPVVVDGRSVFVTLSIGVAASGDEADRPEELIRNADAAMYRAKDLGRARVVVYDSAFRRRARDRMELDHDLHVALDQGQFHLAYQPLFDLQTGLARGTEALLRWEHPERGSISPAEFVPVAEESALIIPIGEWVLDTACRQLAKWRSLLGPSRALSVGVNMSMVQLAGPGLSAMVARVMRRTGINPSDLSLEITESALLVDNPAGIEILNELRALGLHLALDDFGTGYSSLSYLRRFPVDMVKVDRAFVDGLGSGDEDDAIVAAIIFMARALGYVSVAEGVETQEQLERLTALGCDLAQGYLLGRPASADEMTRVFTAGPAPLLDRPKRPLVPLLGPGPAG
ncbi:MAG: putative bifunctional diguanylate cyclase/phosphodiesterase, partial [Acidimicrobiales bacterium]